MEREKNDKVRTITFKNLWHILIHRLPVIAAGACVGTILLFVATQAAYTPQYQSRAVLYIIRQSENISTGDASTEFSLSLKLVNDCTYFLKSHTVLDRVIEDLHLDMTYRQLYSSISVYNPDNTRILEVTVEAASPEQAKQIVDLIGQIAPREIEDVMGYRQLQLFENGTLNADPSNRIGPTMYLLFCGMLAMAIYGVFLIAYLLDDRVRTDEDVEQLLGLSLLGSIPDANAAQRNRYGYYAYQSKRKKEVQA